jgi:hypothetical protein
MTKTHWKLLTNPDYLGAYSLQPGQELQVRILSVEKKFVKGPDGKESECTVAELEGQKPMILNKTNCKTISKIYGTPYIEDWKNKTVIVYATKIKAFGDYVEALRVKGEKPPLPELTPDHPKWLDAKFALQNGTVTIDQIKKNYQVSKENETQLQN